MLSQVERGEANPTFATLWSLTQALGLSLDDLVSATSPAQAPAVVEVLDRSSTPRMEGSGKGVELWLLAPPERVGSVEWYEVHFAAGGCLSSLAHAEGTTEHLTVLDGVVTVRSGESVVEVATGGTARYLADVDHEITNASKQPARVLLVVLGESS